MGANSFASHINRLRPVVLTMLLLVTCVAVSWSWRPRLRCFLPPRSACVASMVGWHRPSIVLCERVSLPYLSRSLVSSGRAACVLCCPAPSTFDDANSVSSNSISCTSMRAHRYHCTQHLLIDLFIAMAVARPTLALTSNCNLNRCDVRFSIDRFIACRTVSNCARGCSEAMHTCST